MWIGFERSKLETIVFSKYHRSFDLVLRRSWQRSEGINRVFLSLMATLPHCRLCSSHDSQDFEGEFHHNTSSYFPEKSNGSMAEGEGPLVAAV